MGVIFDIAKKTVMIWAIFVPISAWASHGVIYDARGSVSITSASNSFSTSEPRRAIVSDMVTTGMMVMTGSNSYAVLKFDDGQIVSMQPNSTLLIRDYLYFPLKIRRSNVDFTMLKGGMHFVTGQIGQSNPAAFRVSTPNGVIRVLGTDFYAVMTNDGLYNQVLSGSISVTNAAGVSVLTAGKYALTSLPTSLPVLISRNRVPVSIFSQLAAIPVPEVVMVAIQEPAPEPVVESVKEPVIAKAVEPVPAVSLPTPGGVSSGGAPVSPTMAMAETNIPSSYIYIGAGVAAGVALLSGGSSSSTTHH